MSVTVLLFGILAVAAVASGISTIMSRNPVASAMSLVLHFFTLAGIYLTLQAQFIAAVQVLVYAGAIMVLVVFMIMLLNVGREEQMHESPGYRTIVGTALGIMLAFQVGKTAFTDVAGRHTLPQEAAITGTTEALGETLFKMYLFPFEAVSLLLLVAVIGAIILAKRKI